MPLIVVLLFYLRGLYRTRLRALVLDGVVPVVSAVSVGAMAVAMLGLFVNGQAPRQNDWLRAWLFALRRSRHGARVAVFRPALGARAPARGQAGADHGRGRGRRAGGTPARDHPEYGLPRLAFSTRIRARSPRSAGATCPVLGTVEDLDETVARTGVRNLIVAFSSVADARVSRLIQHCQELGVEVSVVPRMFDTINNRVGYDTVGGLPLMSFTTVDPRGVQFAIKHALDRVLALLLLVVLSPVILCAALAVRLSSPRAGAVPPAPRRPRRQGVRPLQVPLDAHASPASTDADADEASCSRVPARRRHRARGRRGRGSPHRWSGGFCAAPRLTSCRSCSTCCAGR